MSDLDSRTMEEIERDAILYALSLYKGNKVRAAEHLKLSERTIRTKVQVYKSQGYKGEDMNHDSWSPTVSRLINDVAKLRTEVADKTRALETEMQKLKQESMTCESLHRQLVKAEAERDRCMAELDAMKKDRGEG